MGSDATTSPNTRATEPPHGDDEPVVVAAEFGQFAQLPSLLARSSLSDRAVRVWALLQLRVRDSADGAWPSLRRLAEEAGGCSADAVRRALRELERARWLVVEARYDGARQTSNRYVLTLPPGSSARGEGGTGARGAPSTGASPRSRTTSSQNKNEPPSPPAPEVTEIVDALASAVEEHQGRRPKTTKWARDIDLLLRRGPTDWEQPEPIAADEVLDVIGFTFTVLAETRGGFCWADQVRSGAALRRHWTRLVAERTKRQRTGGAAVDAVFDAYERAGAQPGDLFDAIGGGAR